MKILLIGTLGQLGHELYNPLSMIGQLVAVDLPKLDLANLDALGAEIDRVEPDLLVNASAYTDVDGAEKDPAAALRVNAEAVGLMGERARARQFAMLHVSTDFVFDGEKTEPYTETDTPHPLNEYGRSKLAGEQALTELDAPAITFRTAWVYSLRRQSFVTTMLRLAREHETLKVVDDQIGNPTWCRDLAQALALLAMDLRSAPFERARDRRGVFHLAAPDSTSRYELTRATLELDPDRSAQRVKSVEPVSSDQFVRPAKRPLQVALDCSLAQQRFGLELPPWRVSLARALAARQPLGSA